MADEDKVEISKSELASMKDAIASIKVMEDSIASLTANNKTLLDEKLEVKRLAQEAAEKAALEGGSKDDLNASWQAKDDDGLADQKKGSDENASMLTGIINGLTVDAAANALATKLSLDGTPDALLPHIRPRMSGDIVDGQAVIRIAKDGKDSAMTLDDLETEVKGTTYLAPFIKGSSASGAGDAGTRGTPAGKKFSEYTGAELKAIREQDPAKYDQLKAAG